MRRLMVWSRDNVQYYNLCISDFYDLTVLYMNFLFFLFLGSFDLFVVLFYFFSKKAFWFQLLFLCGLNVCRLLTYCSISLLRDMRSAVGWGGAGKPPSPHPLWSVGHFRKEEKFYWKETTQQPVQNNQSWNKMVMGKKKRKSTWMFLHFWTSSFLIWPRQKSEGTPLPPLPPNKTRMWSPWRH